MEGSPSQGGQKKQNKNNRRGVLVKAKSGSAAVRADPKKGAPRQGRRGGTCRKKEDKIEFGREEKGRRAFTFSWGSQQLTP